VPALAFVLAAGVYVPSLWGGFLYDDIAILVENRRLQDLRALPTVLGYEPARPLLGLTWALNYAVAGTRPWPYHLVNLLIHAANAALVASLLGWIARRALQPDPAAVALWGGALFAVTPMAVESVAYIASRSSLLSACLGLGCLRLAVGLFDAPSRLRQAAALVLLALALATKEDAAAVPLLILLMDVCFVSAGWPAVRTRLGLHAPFLLLPVAGLLARRVGTGAWLPAPVAPRGLYALTQLAAFPEYFFRTLVPVDPAFFRGAALASWPPSLSVFMLALLGAVLLAAALLFRGRAPAWAFAVLWLAAALLPSSSVVPLNEMIVDHRAYLGIAGVSYAVGGFIAHPDRKYFGAVLVLLLAGLSWRYERVLGDPRRAWEDAVRRAPASADAHRALGEAYADRGDPRAERNLRLAAALDPQPGRSLASLGLFLAQQGRRAEAVETLHKAAAVDPDARILDNLGLLLESLGRFAEARQAYERAVAADRALAQPRIRLAALLIASGETERARALLAEAARLEIDAEDAQALEALRRTLP
jgi:tetratricopeptide (TPR) repeat protein